MFPQATSWGVGNILAVVNTTDKIAIEVQGSFLINPARSMFGRCVYLLTIAILRSNRFVNRLTFVKILILDTT